MRADPSFKFVVRKGRVELSASGGIAFAFLAFALLCLLFVLSSCH